MKSKIDKRLDRARLIAYNILCAIEKETEDYSDLIYQGRNPFEYGMRTDTEVLADELIKRRYIK